MARRQTANPAMEVPEPWEARGIAPRLRPVPQMAAAKGHFPLPREARSAGMAFWTVASPCIPRMANANCFSKTMATSSCFWTYVVIRWSPSLVLTYLNSKSGKTLLKNYAQGKLGNGVSPNSWQIANWGATRILFSKNGYGNLVARDGQGETVAGTKTIWWKDNDKAPADATFQAELDDTCNFVIYQLPSREVKWSWNGGTAANLVNDNFCRTSCGNL
jgi:hypothetical protein